MPTEKQTQIDDLLAQPVLARLATADPKTGQPHAVPLWFMWDSESMWISSFKKTQKIKILAENPRAAVLIEPDHAHPSPLQAVLIQGAAEIITEPREFVTQKALAIYTLYMGTEGVLDAEPQSWAHDPDGLILRIRPERTIAW
jgi:nitroimidazol reductase NimA-like FMN-containing flavoprotein (pyridoxamine 5'-phosphate oxidase superfamily)